MKKFLNEYCYAGKCWVCGAPLKEKGATVCKGYHRGKTENKKDEHHEGT
jgi:hypothetical protein